MTEANTLATYPTTSTGKRNWSASAVHGRQETSKFAQEHSFEKMPEIEGGLSALLDIVNPLQHIPGVSSVYRAATGDDISAAGRVFGGLLFGGPVGLVLGIGSTIVAEATGGDPIQQALGSLLGTSGNASAATASKAYGNALKL